MSFEWIVSMFNAITVNHYNLHKFQLIATLLRKQNEVTDLVTDLR